MCETYHSLPGPGGIFDQDSYIIYGLQAVQEGIAVKHDKETNKSGGGKKRTPAFSDSPSVPGARRHG